jgi:hypothetical protein
MSADLARWTNIVALSVMGVCLLLILADLHRAECARAIWNKAPRWIRRTMSERRHRLVMAASIGVIAPLALLKAAILLMDAGPIPPNWLATAKNLTLAAATVGIVAVRPLQSAMDTTPAEHHHMG